MRRGRRVPGAGRDGVVCLGFVPKDCLLVGRTSGALELEKQQGCSALVPQELLPRTSARAQSSRLIVGTLPEALQCIRQVQPGGAVPQALALMACTSALAAMRTAEASSAWDAQAHTKAVAALGSCASSEARPSSTAPIPIMSFRRGAVPLWTSANGFRMAYLTHLRMAIVTALRDACRRSRTGPTGGFTRMRRFSASTSTAARSSWSVFTMLLTGPTAISAKLGPRLIIAVSSSRTR